MTGILKLVAAFGAGYTVCRYAECQFQGVPLDEAFKLGNLLKSVAYLKTFRLTQATPVGGYVQIKPTVTAQLPVQRMPASVADADWS